MGLKSPAGLTATDPAGPRTMLPAETSGRVPRGQMIGRFIVIDQLGAGAGGLVVSAYDPDLDRKVALKVLRPDQVYTGSLGRARERLLREAKAVARIAHGNIITVHEVGSVGDQVYVAMEYIDGGTLRDTLSLRRRSWQQALALLCPAGRGLAAAHLAGLVHRDFKPANVLVGRDDRVVVSDFGLVSTTSDPEAPPARDDAARPRDPSLTDTGTTLGTPAYMAPEQHRGADVDARSDQFAYCVTLFEAVYGVRPFAGNTLLELMKAKDEGDLAKVTNPDVPSWLRSIIIRGLSADPDRRYASMAELLADIDAHRGGRRVRGWIGVAAVALLVPAAIYGYRGLTTTTTPDRRSEIEALRGEVSQKDEELRRNRLELEELRIKAADPADVRALEVRNAELKADVEMLRELLVSEQPRDRPSSATTTTASERHAASAIELPPRQSSGPPLPLEPEPSIVRSVFAGLRRDVERCAGIPDLADERSFEEWQAVMNRAIDYDISVTLTIEPDGRASRVKVAAASAGVRTCVGVAVRRERFPISQKGGPARYAYSLID